MGNCCCTFCAKCIGDACLCCMSCCCPRVVERMQPCRVGGRDREYRVLLLGLDRAGKSNILYQLKLCKFVSTEPTIGFNLECISLTHNDKKRSFDICEAGGLAKIRPRWTHYYQGSRAVIFVVDSTDSDRLGNYDEFVKQKPELDRLHRLTLLVAGYSRAGLGDAKSKSVVNGVPSDVVAMCLDFCNDEQFLAPETSACEELHKLLKEDELRDAILLVLANKQDLENAMDVEEISARLGMQHIRNRKQTIMGCSAKNYESLQDAMKWLHQQFDE